MQGFYLWKRARVVNVSEESNGLPTPGTSSSIIKVDHMTQHHAHVDSLLLLIAELTFVTPLILFALVRWSYSSTYNGSINKIYCHFIDFEGFLQIWNPVKSSITLESHGSHSLTLQIIKSTTNNFV